MGTTTVQGSQSSTSQATPTESEKQLEQLQLQQAQQFQPYALSMQSAGGQLATNLLQGNNSALPQMYQDMMGISPQAMSAQAGELTRQSLPQFQSQGLLDSGTMNQNIQSMIANQLTYPAAQFNIGAKQNLLNLAMGNSAQIQNTNQNNTNTLAQSLAGLRSVSTQGTSNQQTTNPFMQSFYSSLGSGLGSLPGQAASTMKFFGGSCWVAAEIFGGWNEPKTCMARYYINKLAPQWFKNFYLKYGERIAKFIHNKPILKTLIRPLFEYFVFVGKSKMEFNYA